MPEPPDELSAGPPGRSGGWLSWLDDFEWLFYALLGLVLLGGLVYALGRAIWSTGSPVLIGGLVAFLVGTLTSVVRDIRHGRLGWASRGLLAAWGMCVAFLVIRDLVS